MTDQGAPDVVKLLQLCASVVTWVIRQLVNVCACILLVAACVLPWRLHL